MISRLMQYGGIAAKVRAMYGKRLTRADYEKMIHAKSVSEIALYLKSLPGWSEALKSIQPTAVHRAELEKALQSAVDYEYERIYKFISREDHPLLRYLIRRKELDEIFRLLQTLTAGAPAYNASSVPPFYKEHSKIRFERFEHCRSFDDLTDCVRDSIYYEPLVRLPRKAGEPPEFTTAKSVLTSRYYMEILDLIKKNYSGDVAASLKEAIGTLIDLNNVDTVMRIKRYVPEMAQNTFAYIVPYHHNLRPAFLRTMIDAPSADEAYEILKNSPYAKLFMTHHFTTLEEYREQFRYEFYRKLLASPSPGVFTPIAYLNLKEIEVRNIVNIIECVRYGETPGSVSITLTGM